jgi:hypothetical protein
MPALAESSKREPFTIGLPIPYRADFAEADYIRIREGLIPREMEDKWFVYFEEPNLFLHRSWTGKPAYRVTFAAIGQSVSVVEALCTTDLLQVNGPQYQARLLDFLISNLLLGQAKPFPMPDGVKEPAKGVFQHAVSGTGYPEVIAEPRPWWRFWR